MDNERQPGGTGRNSGKPTTASSDPIFRRAFEAALDVYGPMCEDVFTTEEEDRFQAGYQAGLAARANDPTFLPRLAERARFCGQSGFTEQDESDCCHTDHELEVFQNAFREGLAERRSWSANFRLGRDLAFGQSSPDMGDVHRGYMYGILSKTERRKIPEKHKSEKT